MSINHATISGNLTRDAELRRTQSGTAVLTFSIASNDRMKNPATGEWEDRPNYFDCAMFGTRAEKLQAYLAKGAKVAVAGHLRWSAWEHEGQKRSKIELIVDEVEFLSAKNNSAAQPQAPAPEQDAFADADIPF